MLQIKMYLLKFEVVLPLRLKYSLHSFLSLSCVNWNLCHSLSLNTLGCVLHSTNTWSFLAPWEKCDAEKQSYLYNKYYSIMDCSSTFYIKISSMTVEHHFSPLHSLPYRNPASIKTLAFFSYYTQKILLKPTSCSHSFYQQILMFYITEYIFMNTH